MYETSVAERPIRTHHIKIHGAEGFEGMRRAGAMAAACLDMLIPHVQPGVSTGHLDDLAREFILDHGGLPACLGYKGYTKTVCISPNHVVCHGIPGEKTLREGDIANIDVTRDRRGRLARRHQPHVRRGRGFAALAPPVRHHPRGHDARHRPGEARRPLRRHRLRHPVLCREPARQRGARLLRPRPGPGVPRQSNVLHFGRRGEGEILQPGMFFTIEPMVNLGKPQVKVLSDGWTAVTRDKSLSAQYEHSCGVTETGVEIFTLSPTGQDKPEIKGGA